MSPVNTSEANTSVERVQTVVIGAGVVGLAIARQLALQDREVIVLESDSAFGQGISSRNSEVIHAGIYYPPGSLKASLCVRGKQLLYDYCHERHIAANAIGKLIVATSEDEIEQLNELQKKAQSNGVNDTEMISGNAAMDMQPGLLCHTALVSPSTGVVDSHNMMLSLVGDIENHGGMVVFNAPVESLAINNNQLSVTTGGEAAMTLHTKELINSAGLHAVPLANTIKGLSNADLPEAKYAKGNYFKLKGKAPFNMLIYPAPVAGGLGVHLTLDLAGNARFGPDVEWLEQGPPFNYRVDPQRSESFYEAIRRYWPALQDNALQADYAGVRPKIADTTDFKISTPAEHGVNGLFNLFGIESPGLTSSLAIAEYVGKAINAG